MPPRASSRPSARAATTRKSSPEEVKAILAGEVEKVLEPVAKPLAVDRARKPFVILMIGVNGSGKTTTIGKLAAKFRGQGLAVMLAAGDTFRAAAIEQLKVWGERTGAPVLAREQGADAAGLAFDALAEAKARGIDVLLVDTAGRLQNKAGLMAELEKIVRVMKKLDASAPHAVLLVLDATVGQNALSQVELFRQTAGVTGLVMTKLDGTARGGILVALAAKFGVPVHFIGVGEGVEDLEPFAARDFARAIAGLEADSMTGARHINPLLKLALEVGPLVIFFLANAYSDRFGVAQDRRIFAATAVFILATIVALAVHYALVRKLPIMPLVSGVVVVVFGGLTLWLHDELFIKLKPTIVNTLFGLVLLAGLFFGKPLLAVVLDSVFELTEEGWRKLTFRWAMFFFVLAALNEIVWRTQTTDTWVSFKVFGIMPLTVAFALAQTPLLMRHEVKKLEAE